MTLVEVTMIGDAWIQLAEGARWFWHELREVMRETAFEHPVLLAVAVFIGCTAAAITALSGLGVL